jgi:hypothetical protein
MRQLLELKDRSPVRPSGAADPRASVGLAAGDARVAVTSEPVEIDRLSASDALTKGNQQVDPASQDAFEGRFGIGWSQASATNQEASFIVVSWDRLVDRPRFSGICRSARKLVLKSAL